jgi:hypothetical protein
MKSLLAQQHILSHTSKQMQLLEDIVGSASIPSFKEKLNNLGFSPFKASGIEIFQVNVGNGRRFSYDFPFL